MPWLDRFAMLLLNRLLWTSLQASVLVGIIAMVSRLLQRLPATARCTLWWVVALQVVLGLAWQSPIRLPLLSPPAVTAQVGQHVTQADSAEATGSVGLQPTTRRLQQRISWREGLLALWALAVLAQASALVAERRRLRALLRGARPADAPLQQSCAELAKRAGLRRCPRLLVSEQVEAPLVAGWWQAVILWPDRQALSMDETSLALAHELAHLKRGDLWLGIIPALARRLLFFHPLVRWAVHEYIAYREAACDAAAVRGSEADARDYGALLLRLGVSGTGIAGISAASGTFRNLKLRLTMLSQPAASMLRARVWILIVVVAMLGALPYRVVVAGKAAVARDNTAAAPAGGTGELPAQCGIKADDISFCGANFLAYMGAPRDGQGAVLFDKGHVIIAGKHADVVAAKRHYRPGARMLWFRDGNHAYVSRDPALLARADALLAPVSTRYKKVAALNGELAELDQHLEMLNERADRLHQGLDALHQRQALLDREGVRADPKARTDVRVREAALIARIQTQQAQINGVRRSLDAQQTDLQRWRRLSSGTFATLRTGLGKLADAALASGSAQVAD